jgi:ADP-ribose pyrophosphatase
MESSQNPEANLVRRQQIYEGKVVDLEVDTIELPSGKNAIREVVKHPGGVVAIPILDDGKLILIRQFRYPLKKFILELPAGKLDSGLSPMDTICHEIEEETGFHAASVKEELSFYTSPGFCNEIIHFFVAKGLTPVAQRLEEGEHITVEFYTMEDCLRMIEEGAIADAKTILGILWYHHKQSEA